MKFCRGTMSIEDVGMKHDMIRNGGKRDSKVKY
jgi:hypothetical protein